MINEQKIKSQITNLLQTTSNVELEEAKQKFVDQLSSIIIDAIKSARITIPPATINVAGSPSAQTNPAPIILENYIS